MRIPIIFSVAWLLSAGVASSAEARPCDELPNPVYLQIGDTQEPLIKSLGQKLRTSSVAPMTLIYLTSGSCTNIDAAYNGTKLSTNPKYIPSSTSSWTPAMPTPSCTINPAGRELDLANSALFVSACSTATPPAQLTLTPGPIQAYVMIVPKGSLQQAITAEEAYFVFGFGAEGQATPWIDEAFYFIRPITKSTLLSWAANISVRGDKWKGQRIDKSADLLSAVAMSTQPEKTIGILGAEIYDANRSTVNSLAFRAFHQWYAYYPDSSAASKDKKNVRDGHYTVWAPTVWITNSASPEHARAQVLVELITKGQATPAVEFDAQKIVIQRGLIPTCAMQVTRSVEGGDLSPYDPPEPCFCYYEKQNGSLPASCTSCTDDGPCGSGKCRFGFCEAR